MKNDFVTRNSRKTDDIDVTDLKITSEMQIIQLPHFFSVMTLLRKPTHDTHKLALRTFGSEKLKPFNKHHVTDQVGIGQKENH